MAITVPRPDLSAAEKTYLPALWEGLKVTARHFKNNLFGKGKVTMEYPEERWDSHLPEYYRGVPALVTDEHGKDRCVSCQLCEFICPPRAITITPGEIPPGDTFAKTEKRPQEFKIDMIRCIYCGMCEEVCPEQAIFLQKDYLVVGTRREDMVHDKQKLYEIGGLKTGLVNKWDEKK